MANGRNKLRRGDAGRDAGGFVALPWAVLDSPAYARLSMHARALLLEVARQFTRDNNGWLLLSRGYMAARGWKSCDMLDKSKRELLDAGFIFETVKGQRPNKAARYAVTWRALDRHPGYDVGSMEGFQRGAYRLKDLAQIASLVPPHGTEKNASLVPPHGHHLENHLPASAAKDVQDVEGVQEVKVHRGQNGRSRTSEAAPQPARPRRRPTLQARGEGEPVPQPPDPTAQLELLLTSLTPQAQAARF